MRGSRLHLYRLVLLDIVLILTATLAALALRDNFLVSGAKLWALMPYLAATAVSAAIVLPALRVSHGIWRFATPSDFVSIAASVMLVVFCATLATFAYDRLAHVARSLPILQALLAAGLLIITRAAFRRWRLHRQKRRQGQRLFHDGDAAAPQAVLVAGINRLAEAYIGSAAEFAPGRFEVVGVLSQNNRHAGRLIAGRTVLGRVDAIEEIVSNLELHGITVNRVVVTCPLTAMSTAERAALAALEARQGVDVQLLTQQFGFDAPAPSLETGNAAAAPARFVLSPEYRAANHQRLYWRLKRTIDIVGAIVLLTLFAPILLVVALALAARIGTPIWFWQQRPGLGGRPFRVYKLRTMGAARDATGRRLSDEERTSTLGAFVRRTRLDEVPQLLNILRGDMSFIGPRPLLPRDQSDSARARLLIRPGLTGWAQVTGGRDISADDKAALDIWYVQNASFWLDFRIILKTLPMVFWGERIDKARIAQAWDDLKAAGIVRSELAKPLQQDMQVQA